MSMSPQTSSSKKCVMQPTMVSLHGTRDKFHTIMDRRLTEGFWQLQTSVQKIIKTKNNLNTCKTKKPHYVVAIKRGCHVFQNHQQQQQRHEGRNIKDCKQETFKKKIH